MKKIMIVVMMMVVVMALSADDSVAARPRAARNAISYEPMLVGDAYLGEVNEIYKKMRKEFPEADSISYQSKGEGMVIEVRWRGVGFWNEGSYQYDIVIPLLRADWYRRTGRGCDHRMSEFFKRLPPRSSYYK